MSDLRVRRAEPADLAEVVRLRSALWLDVAAAEHEAEAWARAPGCREIASEVWIDDEPSQRAHEELGFQVVDRCVNYRKPLGPG